MQSPQATETIPWVIFPAVSFGMIGGVSRKGLHRNLRGVLSRRHCVGRADIVFGPKLAVSMDGQTRIDLDESSEILERTSTSEYTSSRTLLLNRPKALNALTTGMCDKLYNRISLFDKTETISSVIIRSTQKKAFCAGGDVRAVAESKSFEEGVDFFRREYRLNHLLGSLRRLRVTAFMEGITMGGGAGISVHGPFRIATESTVFAMPECGIALVPDIGATHFLPKLPHNFGMYLALTGTRIQGAAVVAVGLATHFVPSRRLNDLETMMAELDRDPTKPVRKEVFLRALADYTEPVVPIDQYPHIQVIEHCFGQSSLEDVVLELTKVMEDTSAPEDANFARDALKQLVGGSPLSLKLAFHSQRLGKDRSLRQCLQTEFSIMTHLIRTDDFKEGIRAALIDKDRNPKWSITSLDDVKDDTLDKYFLPPEGVPSLFEVEPA